MEAYLDNSATTRCLEEVTDKMVHIMREDYGNPSSMHMRGVEAEKYIKEAKAFFASNLKVNEKEIYFTSGGTESNNLALIGCAMANRRAGNHLITTSVEHASVLNTMKYLEEQGFRVTYLPVDEDGRVSLDALKEAICEETILVSCMYVNNEVLCSPLKRLERSSGKRILRSCFMWMQSRLMENIIFIRIDRELICCQSAVIRSMDRKVWDFYM